MRIGDFGQPRIETLLDEMLDRGRATGSFLFDGPAGVGKDAVALELGRLLNCERDGKCPPHAAFQRAADGRAGTTRGSTRKPAAPPAGDTGEVCGSCHKFARLQHPDLLLVFPVPRDAWDEPTGEGRGGEPKLPTIGRILQARAANPYWREESFERPSSIEIVVLRERVLPKVGSRPVEGRVKVVILSDVEQMPHGNANVLLKTLEEPPENCLLVLTTAVPDQLLPTIVSRCQRLRFAPLAPEWMVPRLALLAGATPARAALAAGVARGSMLQAMRFLDGGLDEVREHAFHVLLGAAAGEELELLEIAQQLHHENPKRRTLVPLTLQMLAVAARDAALLAAAGTGGARRGTTAGSEVVNADRAADLERIARAFTPEALHRIVRAAEAAQRQIAGNVLAEHTLAALFTRIAQAAAPERPVRARGGR